MYRNILLALDLGNASPTLLRKAGGLCSTHGRVTLMHVVEPVGFAYGGDIPLDLSEVTDNLLERAENQLREHETSLKRQYPNLTTDLIITVGRPASELHSAAKDHKCDLILVGSHGRSGLKLLLGSTANSVLHGAGCDVLAVRVRD